MRAIPDDYPVSPKSLPEIERAMNALRAQSGLLEQDRIEPYEFLSALGFKLEVQSSSKMLGARSYADSSQNAIFVTREVAKGIRLRQPRYLYLWGHEVSHLVLHRGGGLKARQSRDGAQAATFLRREESAERQAWTAARALFAPRSLLVDSRQATEIAARVGIPGYAVKKRFLDVDEYERRNPQNSKALEARKLFAEKLLATKSHDKQEVVPDYAASAWKRAGLIDGENPATFRCARGFRVKFDDYGKSTIESQLGWCIWAGEVRAYLDLQTR
ncbi:MAG: ImmA/IrrE family metallo-endopeptidase [Hyphomicrobiaceae bacterium]